MESVYDVLLHTWVIDERETSMNNEPKFKVGDRVTYLGTTRTVTNVDRTIRYWVESDAGATDLVNETSLQYAKLSEADAWLEVALMVGREVQYFTDEPYRVLNESVLKEIRHQAYQILGGNGLDCNAHHEEYKARINQLIERAKARG